MSESTLSQTRKNERHPFNWGRFFIYVVLVIGALVSVIPFVYMVLSSFKSYGSVIANNFWPWWPFGTEPLQFSNYPEAITDIGFDKTWNMPLFFRYLANSLIVSGCIVLGTVTTSTLAAYAFAYIKVPGKSLMFLLILATLMIPNDLTLVPKLVMMYNFKWYNNYQALIIPFTVSVFGIFLLRQYFMQIPKDLFDAAKIDGAGHLRYLWSIVMPLSKPALITIALLNFIWSWDSFKWPLLVTRDSSMRVLAVGLQQFLVGEGGTKIHLMMAFASMVVVPVLIFYFFTQKYFTEGIAKTGIKG
ncbi:MAG TPA: carbohydrate ABC transporter permease [Anaerolineaceae bacterium]|nr:carbohydrate ABC transporter permease [Anaerolineaceae bacterium]HPN51151.1 carbohydrate ABC transporter permease [Anaerolineaceae bacterium]